jgi:phosphoribosylamine--glycine ligase
MAKLGDCHPVRAEDVEGLVELARALEADLVVVGPEAPLVAGLADELRRAGISVFGPGAEAARIEGSKSFAKEVMAAAGVPTARALPVARPPCVLKADGLAAGKGVFVCHTQEELDAGLRAAGALGQPLVIEELLDGDEVSILTLCDGQEAVALPSAQDYKRAEDGDLGPNTGGMGSFSPVAGLGPAEVEELVDSIHRPILAELARRRTPFVGTLFAGLMLTPDGPRVLEFNARFGDPETQALLPLLEDDLLEALAAAAGGDLAGTTLDVSADAAVTVVVASADYPERGDAGTPIRGLAEAAEAGGLVFHAGTALREGELVTNGGRILNVTGVGPTLVAARARAYDALGQISFEGMRYRADIGATGAGVRA